MKFKKGDRVQIISDASGYYSEYIGYFATVINIDERDVYPYALDIYDFDDTILIHYLEWEEKGISKARISRPTYRRKVQ